MPLPIAPWQAAAACQGLPAGTVFARRVADAEPALRACAVCTVRRACEETVAPAESWFDGVCAGRLWRNGRPVTLPDALVAALSGPADEPDEPVMAGAVVSSREGSARVRAAGR